MEFFWAQCPALDSCKVLCHPSLQMLQEEGSGQDQVSLLDSGATTQSSKVSVLPAPSSRRGGVLTWVHAPGLRFTRWEIVVGPLSSSVLLWFVFCVTAHGVRIPTKKDK